MDELNAKRKYSSLFVFFTSAFLLFVSVYIF
ncbi:hypothetical protein [Bacillus sp. AK031]